MTWIIPSDREGHWNPAGLSLKSPRFLSNRWGPPQSAFAARSHNWRGILMLSRWHRDMKET